MKKSTIVMIVLALLSGIFAYLNARGLESKSKKEDFENEEII